MENKIKVAIQKSGRLSEDSYNLLKSIGIKFNRSKDQLIAYGTNYPIEVLLTRDDDIPTLINEGTCDIGIVGKNVFEEFKLESIAKGNRLNIDEIYKLPYGSCRLSFAVPEKSNLNSLEDFSGKKIATSYPNIVNNFLKENNINAGCIEFKGSVEIAPKLGTCDLICDLVSTGTTLRANGLIETQILLQSTAEIYAYRNISQNKSDLVNTFIERVNAVIKASNARYIMLHAPKAKVEKIVSLIPGSESPTIIPLTNIEDKVAVHALCIEEIFWETLEDLKAEGATSILVLPIEKILD